MIREQPLQQILSIVAAASQLGKYIVGTDQKYACRHRAPQTVAEPYHKVVQYTQTSGGDETAYRPRGRATDRGGAFR